MELDGWTHLFAHPPLYIVLAFISHTLDIFDSLALPPILALTLLTQHLEFKLWLSSAPILQRSNQWLCLAPTRSSLLRFR